MWMYCSKLSLYEFSHIPIYFFDRIYQILYDRLQNPPETNIQRVPALRAFWDLEKTVLHEIRVKVNSVQKACAKCFAVQILKFEILEIT